MLKSKNEPIYEVQIFLNRAELGSIRDIFLSRLSYKLRLLKIKMYN